MHKTMYLSVLLGFAVAGVDMECQAQTVRRTTSLGTLDAAYPSAMAQAQGISGDGAVVAGYGTLKGISSHYRAIPRMAAFRWTREKGMEKLAYLPGGGDHAAAEAISANGKVAVGVSDDTSESGRYLLARAVRWEADGTVRALPMPAGASMSTATGVSRDGAIVVGFSSDALRVRRALRWSGDDAPRDLGTFGGNAAYATGVSNDGKYIVGVAENAESKARAFLWTERGGMKSLGVLPGFSGSLASAISADGSVVVGSSANDMEGLVLPFDGAVKGYIWRSDSGTMQEIVNTLGGRLTMPTSVSADGKVVAGVASDGHERRHAFRWTRESGMTADTAPSTQRLAFIRGLSEDGRYCAGRMASEAAFRAQWF